MTVEVTKHKSSVGLFLRCQNACAGAIFQGYTLTEMLFAGNHLLTLYGFDIFDIKDEKKTVNENIRLMNVLIGPILCLTGFLTTYFTPYITNKLERRQCMIIADIVFLLAAVLTQIPSWEVFMIARLLMGFTCGMDLIAVPLYIREISPDQMAAKTGSQFQANISLGVILGFLMGLPLEEVVQNEQAIGINWRWVFIFPALFSIQRLLGLLFIYKIDTPFYYYRNHEFEKGRLALEEIYQDKFVIKMEEQLLNPGSIDVPDMENLQERIEQKQSMLSQSVDKSLHNEEKSSEKEALMDSFNNLVITDQQEMSYKNRLRVGLVINFLQQMTGCTAMVGLSPIIIGLVTDDYETLRCIILGTYLFLFFVAMLGVGFNRKLARKKYLVGGYLLCSIFQFSLSIISYNSNALQENRTIQFLFLLFIFFFYATYNFTIGPVTIILTSDILKDRGFSYSLMMNWLGIFFSIAMLLIPYEFIYFIIYGTCSLLGFLFSMKYIVETKWMNFIDIQNAYQDNLIPQRQQQQQQQQQQQHLQPDNFETDFFNALRTCTNINNLQLDPITYSKHNSELSKVSQNPPTSRLEN